MEGGVGKLMDDRICETNAEKAVAVQNVDE
jgi:hypothetical protein